MRKLLRPAVFMDRDGVLTIEKGRIIHPKDVILYADSVEAVKKIKTLGFLVIILTNQSGIARDIFSENELIELHEKVIIETNVDAIYYCPHYEKGLIPRYSVKCNCRKPKPGMLLEACNDYYIDLEKSWLVGDRQSDIQLGSDMGLRTILVRTGYGGSDICGSIKPDYTVDGVGNVYDVIYNYLERDKIL